MPLLLCFILAFMITKTLSDGKTDRELARKGIVSPRLQAKYGDGAKAKTAQYGMVDFLADAWSDLWADRTQIRRAAKDAAAGAEPSPGKAKASWWQRIKAARGAVKRWSRKVVDPVGPKPKPEPPTVAEPAPGTVVDDFDTHRTCPDCGARLTEVDDTWWHPDGPDCPNRPTADDDTAEPGTDKGPVTCWRCKKPYGSTATESRCDCRVCIHHGLYTGPECPHHQKPEPEFQPEPVAEETPVTAPTGDAVIYETTVAELDAILAKQRDWLDAAIVAEAHAQAAKSAIDGIQQGYRDSAAATGSVNEHLQVLLPGDGETLAHVGTAGDAMPPNKVDQYFDHLELIEDEARAQKEAAEAAIAATEAALKRIQDEYGEDTAKVAERMNGNPEFLSSGGGGGSSPAPVSVAA
jgi:hypothetical protein